MLKFIESLKLTVPSKREVAGLAAATAVLMAAGGAALFGMDAACAWLFSLIV